MSDWLRLVCGWLIEACITLKTHIITIFMARMDTTQLEGGWMDGWIYALWHDANESWHATAFVCLQYSFEISLDACMELLSLRLMSTRLPSVMSERVTVELRRSIFSLP